MDLQRTGSESRRILQVVIHTVSERSEQGIIGIVVHRHGKTGREAGCA